VEVLNPDPVIVTMVAALPASIDEGETELITGVTVGAGFEVEDPEPPSEQPKTRHNKTKQITAIQPLNLFSINASLAYGYYLSKWFSR
jgi:hypothetical protein